MRNDRIIQGAHGRYRWIEQITNECLAFGLLQRWPHIVVGRCVAVTMYDCGPIKPHAEDAARGWSGVNGILVIPRVDNPRDIPGSGEGDQVFVFDSPPAQSVAGEFMNYGDFTLESAEDHLAAMDPTWDRIAQQWMFDERLTALQEEFWTIMEQQSARAFIGDGVGRFLFVTDDESTYSEVARWMSDTQK